MEFNSVIFQYASIGDYIFLIMIVVVSIIQAITQNKKKRALMDQEQARPAQKNAQTFRDYEKEPETMAGYETPLDNIFDSFERVLTPEIEDEKYGWGDDYAEEVKEEKPEKEVKSTKYQTEKLIAERVEKSPVLLTPKSTAELPVKSRKSAIREGFSLRKAVIYSEILNRKYT